MSNVPMYFLMLKDKFTLNKLNKGLNFDINPKMTIKYMAPKTEKSCSSNFRRFFFFDI